MASKISNIEKEFILTQAIQDRLPIRIHGSKEHIELLPTSLDKENYTLENKFDYIKGFVVHEKVTAYVSFRTQTISFKTKIKSVGDHKIVLELPDAMYKSLMRKYIRIHKPHGISLSFKLHNENFSFDFPISEEYSAVEDPGLSESFDARSMQSLVESFKSRVQEIASSGKIVMFKQKKPETLEEIIISKFGRILYIPSTKAPLPVHDPYPQGRLILQKNIDDFEGPDMFLTGSKFQSSLIKKQNENIHSEIYAPILYYQYVTGYVYLANLGSRTKALDLSVVNLAYDFSRILARFLKTHDYFKDSQKPIDENSYKAQIIDVSAKGLLLSVVDNNLKVLLKNIKILSLSITLHDEKDTLISTPAKIMRQFDSQGTIYYGLEFQDMKKEDIKILYKFLYHKDFTENTYNETESSFI